MKTHYKHIYFTEEPMLSSTGPSVWFCRNKKSEDVLGTCTWYELWNRYVFTGEEAAVFDAGCLRDVAMFCEQATREART